MNDLSLSRPELIALINDLSTELIYMCSFAVDGRGTKAALAALRLAERAENVVDAEEKALEEQLEKHDERS